MASSQPQPARRTATIWIVFGALVALAVGLGYLFFSPSSPLRPQASEIGNDSATFSAPQQATFRDGTVSKVSGDKITVDESNDNSFTFTLSDTVAVRSLNADSKFELVDKNLLKVGAIVSVFYQETNSGLLIDRVDILDEN